MGSTPPHLPGYRMLARTATPDCPVALHQRGPRYVITACSHVLMSNDDTRSELALGRLTADLLRNIRQPRVLVGGLGMGFTLRALLDRLPGRAHVVVTELLPAVVQWNQDRLGHLSDHPVDDTRVDLRIGDVARLVRGRPAWDAIVLDIDNGPDWLVQRRNSALYGTTGIARLMSSLRSRGFLALWSATRHARFENRVRAMGLGWRLFQRVSRSGPHTGPVLYVISLQPRGLRTTRSPMPQAEHQQSRATGSDTRRRACRRNRPSLGSR